MCMSIFLKLLFEKVDSSVERVVGNDSPAEDIMRLSEALQAARMSEPKEKKITQNQN